MSCDTVTPICAQPPSFIKYAVTSSNSVIRYGTDPYTEQPPF